MADINFETEQLARLMEQVNAELIEFGEVTKNTQSKVFDANMKAKFGVDNATKAITKSGEAVGHLAKAATEAAKSMYDNKKGASAFNSSVEHAGTAVQLFGVALMTLGGPIGLLVGGLAMLTGGVIKLGKVVNEQSDAVYKGFQDLSKSGGAAADGMSGLFGDIQKLGLGFQDLEGYTRLIADSNKELALFGGSVIKGRKQFADMGQAMAPFRESLFNAGMTQEEINEASMGYLKLQSRIGQSQNKTADELAMGARKYLIEQDALTKLTGMTRKEQEDAREEIRSQERFAATLAELRAKGQYDEAESLEQTFLVLHSQSKEAAQGFADVSTGMLTTEAAQKSYLATQGESMRVSRMIQSGQLSAAQGAQLVAKAHGATAKSMQPLAKMGVFADAFGDYAGMLKLDAMSQQDIEKQLTKVKKEQIEQGVTGKKAADAEQQQQTDLRISQQQTTLALQRMVNYAVEPTTSIMAEFGKAVESATIKLNQLVNFFGIGGPAKEKTELEKDAKAAADLREKRDREVKDLEVKVITAKSEYDKQILAEQLKIAKQRQTDALQAEKQAKTALSGGATGKPSSLDKVAPGMMMGSKLGMLMGQSLAKKLFGKTESQKTPPGGPSAPSEYEGAKSKSGKSAADLLDFTGLSGSVGAFDGLDARVKDAVLAAAEDYLSVTGKKLQINSAARSAEDQKRLWNETVAAGRPGRGPNGYPVARPGTSPHEKGLAVDIQNYLDPAAVSALNNQGLRQKVAGDPPHFSFGDGGIASGPTTGYPAELHGTEAVIPLKNGRVPVSLDIKSMGSKNTDQAAIKDLTAKLNTNNNVTKKIIDPTTWKDILNSGVSMNYNMSIAEITSKMIPEIGKEIGQQIQEIKSTNDSTSSIAQMAAEFKNVMLDAVKTINTSNTNSTAQDTQLSLLSQLVKEQQNSNDLQKKLLQVAAN
jgi:hypothetical protein